MRTVYFSLSLVFHAALIMVLFIIAPKTINEKPVSEMDVKSIPLEVSLSQDNIPSASPTPTASTKITQPVPTATISPPTNVNTSSRTNISKSSTSKINGSSQTHTTNNTPQSSEHMSPKNTASADTKASSNTENTINTETPPIARNIPLTKEIQCLESDKRQGLRGRIIVNVKITPQGRVSSATIAKPSYSPHIAAQAQKQALNLTFPIIRTPAGQAISSTSTIILKYDCAR